MREFMEAGGLVLLLIFAVGAVVMPPIAWLADNECRLHWHDSGLRSEWGFVSGCMVRLRDGRWVPASVVRMADILEDE
jgi:hypothetical protein